MEPDGKKHELRLNPPGPWNLAAHALVEHRYALVANLNRLVGPPSAAMAALQQEFVDECMDPAETIAFAKFCYGLLTSAVKKERLPP